MACCRCCCGGVDCTEGQEGKCCCGGVSGTCCQPGEYCCGGVCQPGPCSAPICSNASVSSTVVNEGDSVTFSVTLTAPPSSDDWPVGANFRFRWVGTSDTAASYSSGVTQTSDWHGTDLYGGYAISSGSTVTVHQTVTFKIDCDDDGDETLALQVYVWEGNVQGGPETILCTTPYVTVKNQFNPLAFTWSAPSYSLNEGGSVTLSFSSTTPVCPPTGGSVTFLGAGASEADVTFGGTWSRDADGNGSISVSAVDDALTEGGEGFRLELRDGADTVVAVSPLVTILASDQPTYSVVPHRYSLPESPLAIVSFLISTTNVPGGTTLTWETVPVSGNITDSDFWYTSGSVVLYSDGTGGFNVRVSDDTLAENDEQFAVQLKDASGAVVATSPPVTILANDQPCPPYDASISSYSLNLRTYCVHSWFDDLTLTCPLSSSTSTTRLYGSSWKLYKTVQQSDGSTAHYIRGEVYTNSADPSTNYVRIQVYAWFTANGGGFVGYSTITFPVNCSNMRFTVTNTSGDPTSNPAKGDRWSDGGCTADYQVQVSWESSAGAQALASPPSGPGTEMKKLLAKIGITSTPTCSCNQRAEHMDKMGVEWCEQHKAEIVGWLREEAKKRKLPFLDAAGYMLLNLAIKRAKKANRK